MVDSNPRLDISLEGKVLILSTRIMDCFGMKPT